MRLQRNDRSIRIKESFKESIKKMNKFSLEKSPFTCTFRMSAHGFLDEEPRTIPLVYLENEDRQELYVEGVNGENEFSRSSTIG